MKILILNWRNIKNPMTDRTDVLLREITKGCVLFKKALK